MNKLKILELFGGIGACSKALERLGIDYEIADYVEIDKYAVKSFNAIHNTNFEPQDITQWDKDIDVDLVIHGSPCQDFSLAGLQAGGDEGSGTRSSLMYETIRIVKKLKPKYVIWENVKNLLSKKHRHNFDSYLEIMESLGYQNYYQILNAKDYGMPQNRERVFTISIRNDIDKEFIFPEKQELKLKLKDMIEDEVDEKYYLSDDKIDKISHWKGFQKPFEKVQGKNSVVPTLTARGAGEEHNGMITFSDNLEETTNLQEQCLNIKSGAYARNFGSKGKLQDKEYCDTLTASMGTGGGNVPILKIKNATKKGYQEVFEGDSVNLAYPNSKTRRGRVGEQVSQTLQCNDSMGVVLKSKQKQLISLIEKITFEEGKVLNMDLYNQTTNENVSQCLTEPNHNSQRLFDGLRIRKLTPKECWRLMGFDDEDFDKTKQAGISDTQLYKQAGNSIVVNVLMAIFNELLKKEGE